MSKPKKLVALIVRDGWGMGSPSEYNAVENADTPNDDRWMAECPHTVLDAAGTAVGVPEGGQGSSEVGHLNMGAGRIVKQEEVRVNEGISNGTLFEDEAFQRLVRNCKGNGAAFHVMGLVQDQGVHAQQQHLFTILEYLKKQDIGPVWVHFFGDGRDTPPRSALGFLADLEEHLAARDDYRIGTLMGRYYAMDRGQNYDLTDQAYRAIVHAEGRAVASAREAIEQSYEQDTVPDGGPMTDEYFPPCIIGDYPGVKDGDSVMHFNYRQDRAIQLTQAFVEEDYPGKLADDERVDVTYCGLTRYYDSFKYGIVPPLNESPDMKNLVGEVVARAGLKQLRISETQKFRHVTSFFNGKKIEPNEGETQVEIEGRFDASAFAQHPEMDAERVAERAVQEIGTGEYSMVVLNFANCDMVGHTGNYDAALQAVETVDRCAGQVVEAVLAQGGVALVTADHGNAEEMRDPQTGAERTAHTINPVNLIYVGDDCADVKLVEHGKLADIGVTIVQLLGLEQPADMTAENLLV